VAPAPVAVLTKKVAPEDSTEIAQEQHNAVLPAAPPEDGPEDPLELARRLWSEHRPKDAAEQQFMAYDYEPEWLTPHLPAFYSQENEEDPIVWMKVFTPAGRGTWYILEYQPETEEEYGTWFTYCLSPLEPSYDELGYANIQEMRETKTKMGLHLEVDLHWTPERLSRVKEKIYGVEKEQLETIDVVDLATEEAPVIWMQTRRQYSVDYPQSAAGVPIGRVDHAREEEHEAAAYAAVAAGEEVPLKVLAAYPVLLGMVTGTIVMSDPDPDKTELETMSTVELLTLEQECADEIEAHAKGQPDRLQASIMGSDGKAKAGWELKLDRLHERLGVIQAAIAVVGVEPAPEPEPATVVLTTEEYKEIKEEVVPEPEPEPVAVAVPAGKHYTSVDVKDYEDVWELWFLANPKTVKGKVKDMGADNLGVLYVALERVRYDETKEHIRKRIKALAKEAK